MVYCTPDDVKHLFGDISDDVPPEMFNTVIQNSTAWVNNKLNLHDVPIPTDSDDLVTMKTITCFYSASQILNSLDHGDDRIENHNDWYLMAVEMLDDYIGAYENNGPNGAKASMVKHSRAKTYNQKRGRGRQWVR